MQKVRKQLPALAALVNFWWQGVEQIGEDHQGQRGRKALGRAGWGMLGLGGNMSSTFYDCKAICSVQTPKIVLSPPKGIYRMRVKRSCSRVIRQA